VSGDGDGVSAALVDVSAQRAVLERLFDNALNGDIRALTQLIRLAQEHSIAEPSSVERLSANDQQILEIYKSRVAHGCRGSAACGHKRRWPRSTPPQKPAGEAL
jgi:hypothetical protein